MQHCNDPLSGFIQEDDETDAEQPTTSNGQGGSEFHERAKFLPLRLSADDRRMLRLLEAALSVSEYTDKVCQSQHIRST